MDEARKPGSQARLVKGRETHVLLSASVYSKVYGPLLYESFAVLTSRLHLVEAAMTSTCIFTRREGGACIFSQGFINFHPPARPGPPFSSFWEFCFAVYSTNFQRRAVDTSFTGLRI